MSLSKSDELLRRTAELQSNGSIHVRQPLLRNASAAKSWSKRVSVTVPASGVEASLYKFPLLLLLDGNNFPFSEAGSDGSDIRFSTKENPAGPSDYLPFEKLWYDSTEDAETAAFYVRIPILSSRRATVFYIYFTGTPTATDYSDPAGVWEEYSCVVHMDNSDWTTVPLFLGIERKSEAGYQYSQPVSKTGEAIAAKKFNDSPANMANFALISAADPHMIIDLRSSVAERIGPEGFLEIGSASAPDESGIRSPLGYLRNRGIAEYFKTFYLTMIGDWLWVDVDEEALTGTVSGDEGSYLLRRSGTTVGDEAEVNINGGITIDHTGVEEVHVVRAVGPVLLSGVLTCESGSKNVEGEGTRFTSEVKVGDVLKIGDYQLPGTVQSVDDSNDITMTRAAGKDHEENGYVGLPHTIIKLWEPIAKVGGFSGVGAAKGHNAIDYSNVDFLRWYQDLGGYNGTIGWKNARVQYKQTSGGSFIADSGRTLLDSSASHTTLERVGPPTESADGIVGYCQEWDGSDHYLRFNTGLEIGENSFRIEAWFKAASGATRFILLGNSQICFYVTDSGVALEWDYQNILEVVGPTGLLSDFEWHHLVFCRDKDLNRFYVYVDGTEYPLTTEWAGSDIVFTEKSDDEGAEPLYICSEGPYGRDGYDGTSFVGLVDEVRLTYAGRNASWVKATYDSHMQNLLTVGSLELGAASDTPNGVQLTLSDGGSLYVHDS